MSFLTAKELHCDGCGEWMRLETGLLSREWPELRKEGWSREGGRHYCPRCGLNGSWENHPSEDSDSQSNSVVERPDGFAGVTRPDEAARGKEQG